MPASSCHLVGGGGKGSDRPPPFPPSEPSPTFLPLTRPDRSLRQLTVGRSPGKGVLPASRRLAARPQPYSSTRLFVSSGGEARRTPGTPTPSLPAGGARRRGPALPQARRQEVPSPPGERGRRPRGPWRRRRRRVGPGRRRRLSGRPAGRRSVWPAPCCCCCWPAPGWALGRRGARRRRRPPTGG